MTDLQNPPVESPRPARFRLRVPPRVLRIVGSEGWKGALRELALIVAGVLLALAAQAWWQARESRDREVRYLVRLENDLRSARMQLQESHFAHMYLATEMEGALRLVARSHAAPLPPAAADSFRTSAGLLGHVLMDMDAPYSATYEELKSSGDLQIIRSDSLRIALAEYEALLQSVRQADAFAREQAVNVVQPFLRGDEGAAEPESLLTGTVRSPFAGDGTALLRSPRFWSGAALQMQSETEASGRRAAVFAPLLRAERLVRAELRARGVNPAAGRVSLDREALNRFVGAYQVGDGTLIAISRDQDRLTVQYPGSWPVPLYPVADTAFASANNAITCVFHAARKGGVPAVTYIESSTFRVVAPLLVVGTVNHGAEIRAVVGRYDAYYVRSSAPNATRVPEQREIHLDGGRAYYERIYPADHPAAYINGSHALVPVGRGRFWMLGYPVRPVTIVVVPDGTGGSALQFEDDGVVLDELTLVRSRPAPGRARRR